MNNSAPFQKIPEACRTTGLSQHFLRTGCRNGSIPHIMSGNTYFVNVPALLEQLDRQSRGAEGAKLGE